MAKIFADAPQTIDRGTLGEQYLLGNEPPVFDILFWNNDTHAPAGLHAWRIPGDVQDQPTDPAKALRCDGTPDGI